MSHRFTYHIHGTEDSKQIGNIEGGAETLDDAMDAVRSAYPSAIHRIYWNRSKPGSWDGAVCCIYESAQAMELDDDGKSSIGSIISHADILPAPHAVDELAFLRDRYGK